MGIAARCGGAMGIAARVGVQGPAPSGQNARLRAGIEKKTDGVTLVSTRHSPRAIPIAPLQLRRFRWHDTCVVSRNG